MCMCLCQRCVRPRPAMSTCSGRSCQPARQPCGHAEISGSWGLRGHCCARSCPPGSQAASGQGSGATARMLAAMWSTPPRARTADKAARSRITCGGFGCSVRHWHTVMRTCGMLWLTHHRLDGYLITGPLCRTCDAGHVRGVALTALCLLLYACRNCCGALTHCARLWHGIRHAVVTGSAAGMLWPCVK